MAVIMIAGRTADWPRKLKMSTSRTIANLIRKRQLIKCGSDIPGIFGANEPLSRLATPLRVYGLADGGTEVAVNTELDSERY